jgi:phosphohistidine phosphatase
MKKLYLIRHAKSSWEDFSLSDFDRTLNKRGEKDAPFMGNILKNKDIDIDIILSSPAKRAKQTAKIIANKLNCEEKIVFEPNIYEASLQDIENIVKDINNSHKTAFLFGHNPSLNMFAYKYLHYQENIPTCTIVAIEFECKNWNDISPKNAKKIFIEYPKKYKE